MARTTRRRSFRHVCRHGTCSYCDGNRQHASRMREAAADVPPDVEPDSAPAIDPAEAQRDWDAFMAERSWAWD